MQKPTKLYNYNCIPDTSCPEGTFYNEEENICQECSYKCKFCDNRKECKVCYENFVLDPNKRCVSKCPEGNKVNDKKICEPCTIPYCSTCEGNPEKCLSCKETKVLYDNQCKDYCEISYFKDNGYCKPCSNNCIKCNSLFPCEQCNKDYYLKEGYCVDNCNYIGYVAVNRNCDKCSNKCRNCSTPNICDVCEEGYLIKNNICVSECGIGYYPSRKFPSKCIKCPDGCNICTDSYNCSSCNSGWYKKIIYV